jgi:hypothetical protein
MIQHFPGIALAGHLRIVLFLEVHEAVVTLLLKVEKILPFLGLQLLFHQVLLRMIDVIEQRMLDIEFSVVTRFVINNSRLYAMLFKEVLKSDGMDRRRKV